ncbi:TonB-linked outer membrane protein, SusC/RagA family [Parafilimonas terrae]|uniref:TonB-linked outer membrane protein, SusC/RagA family n=1 Tax=Parafilimonas terrae TaxID=1465490 RepID=A0A1I5XSL9_9BACT|nr:TonB-linked outer membrane protein, SusC/RagA family [Parafilimonas terrae]
MIRNQLSKKLLLFVCGFCLCIVSIAQTVNGKVTDENNAPLEGVSVQVVNKPGGVTTNTNGEFAINAEKGASLQFSYVGYATITKAVTGNYITVQMAASADNGLSDVIVVGYGTQKKVNLSGAVSVISKKELENRPVNNAVQALQGLSPGLIVSRTSGQPGAEGWNINIRGYSSLNGTNNPLLIVDGVEYSNLTLINPNDIESISVLKDASAAAIYGAKASNGVLLITTKAGKSGKVTVNYTGMYQIKKTLSLPQTVPYHISAALQNIANINNGGAPSYTDAQIAMFADPSVTLVPDDPTNVFYYKEMDYVGMTINKSFGSSQHNVNVTGGNENTKYYIGLGYNDNNGMFKVGPDDNKRTNARINLTTRFNKVLSLDARLSYIQNRIEAAAGTLEGDYGLLYNIYNLRPIYPVFVPGSNDEKYVSISGNNTYATMKDGGYNNTTQNVLDGVFTLKAEHLVKGLVLSTNYSPHLEQDNQDLFYKTVPLHNFDKASASFIQNAWLNTSNSLRKYRTSQNWYTFNALADYTLAVQDHHFHVLGGFQYQQFNYDLTNAYQSNLTNNNLPTLNYTTNSNLPVTAVRDDLQSNAWQSFFGRFNYDYKGKYFVEATLRNDASSRLAPGHRSQTFPAFSAAWRISQENWFNNSGFFSELKLRGSWGKLGNAQLGKLYENNYLSIATLNTGVYPFNNTAATYIYQGALPSEGLGWETVTTSDIGLDFGLFKGKLSGSFDYYKRVNDNMLIPVNLPAVLGVTPSTTNAAAMETKGWDFDISWKDRIGNVSYYVGFNLSDNQNKITKYLGNVVYAEGINTAIPGMPINSIYGYKSLGYFQNEEEVEKGAKQFGTTNQGPGDIKYLDVNGDGVINGGTGTPDDHGDMVYLGNTSPRYNYGINLGAQWKGFDLSVFLQGTGKRSYIIYPTQAIPYVQSWRYPLDNYVNNYWTEDNRNANFPRPIAGGGTNTHINSAFVQNGSYIRLKNLQVGYSLPSSVISKIKAQNIRVFFSGQDILTHTKAWYKYFDPESPSYASYVYPYFAVYAFGLNVTF